jgi:hypothetical protein
MARTGGCLCGDIGIEISDAPRLVEFCHCESCRRSVGAPVMAWAGVAPEAFDLVRGTLRRYASSPGVERTFCGRCGTSMTQFAAVFPELIYVSLAALHDADSISPEIHIWRSERLPWFETADDLPRYLRFKADGVTEAPREK